MVPTRTLHSDMRRFFFFVLLLLLFGLVMWGITWNRRKQKGWKKRKASRSDQARGVLGSEAAAMNIKSLCHHLSAAGRQQSPWIVAVILSFESLTTTYKWPHIKKKKKRSSMRSAVDQKGMHWANTAFWNKKKKKQAPPIKFWVLQQYFPFLSRTHACSSVERHPHTLFNEHVKQQNKEKGRATQRKKGNKKKKRRKSGEASAHHTSALYKTNNNKK